MGQTYEKEIRKRENLRDTGETTLRSFHGSVKYEQSKAAAIAASEDTAEVVAQVTTHFAAVVFIDRRGGADTGGGRSHP